MAMQAGDSRFAEAGKIQKKIPATHGLEVHLAFAWAQCKLYDVWFSALDNAEADDLDLPESCPRRSRGADTSSGRRRHVRVGHDLSETLEIKFSSHQASQRGNA